MLHISRVQVKTTHYTTSDGNFNMNEKRESAYANAGMIQILELSYKKFKTIIIKMPWMSNYRDAWNEWKSQQKHRDIKKEPNEIFELKYTVFFNLK